MHSFSETVNTSTLNPTGLSLYNAYSSAVPFGNFISYTLTGGSTSSEIRPTITIELTEEDLNQLKALQRSGLSGLCSVVATCYVRVDSTLIEDVSGNPVQVLTESPVPTVDGLGLGPRNVAYFVPHFRNCGQPHATRGRLWQWHLLVCATSLLWLWNVNVCHNGGCTMPQRL